MREGADAKRRELYVTSSASHLRLPTACGVRRRALGGFVSSIAMHAESVLHPAREKRSSEDRAKACCEIRSNQETRFPSAKCSGRAYCGAAIPSPILRVRKPLENQAETELENETDDCEVDDVGTPPCFEETRFCRDLARCAQRCEMVLDGAKFVR